MELEHDCKLIPLSKFDEEVRRIQSEGYMSIPGIEPVIVYHVVRMKGTQLGAKPLSQAEHKVEVKVQDHRVFTLKSDGKYYTEDGKEVPPDVINDPNHPLAPKGP